MFTTIQIMKSSESSFTSPSHILFQHFSEFPFFSSRTLFIGNLEKTSTYEDLKRTFFKYGKILKIELKKVGGMDLFSMNLLLLFTIVCMYNLVFIAISQISRNCDESGKLRSKLMKSKSSRNFAV